MTATEQQQQISDLDYDIEGMCIHFIKDKAGRNEWLIKQVIEYRINFILGRNTRLNATRLNVMYSEFFKKSELYVRIEEQDQAWKF